MKERIEEMFGGTADAALLDRAVALFERARDALAEVTSPGPQLVADMVAAAKESPEAFDAQWDAVAVREQARTDRNAAARVTAEDALREVAELVAEAAPGCSGYEAKRRTVKAFNAACTPPPAVPLLP